MRAAIERQKGRIEARRGDMESALSSFDCAIAALEGSSPHSPQACVFAQGRSLPDTAVNAPLLVETQLESASIAARDPRQSRESVLATYRSAIQSMPSLSSAGGVSRAALQHYFELLTQSPPSPARDEEYFHAMQVIGEPAIAREYAQLQKVVSADGEVATMLRQRSDLERQLIRLRYEISGATPGATNIAALEAERAAAAAMLDQINDKLLAANGIGALEDQPATIADVRKALMPGEVYLKLVSLSTEMFAIAISQDGTQIYQLRQSLQQIDRLANGLLVTAHTDEEGVIHPFAVADAQLLYNVIAGPAAPMLTGASRIVYNPAGLLRQVPLAILVTDPASAAAYAQQPAKGDYSKIAFVGRTTETAIALSPRAFLRARLELAPSNAPNKFLGLGENAPPQDAPGDRGARPMPFDCALTYDLWPAPCRVARRSVPMRSTSLRSRWAIPAPRRSLAMILPMSTC